jgi:tRNA 2-thiouridine synthesizing protein A
LGQCPGGASPGRDQPDPVSGRFHFTANRVITHSVIQAYNILKEWTNQMSSIRELDLTGLKCPMPIVEMAKLMKQLEPGEEFTATANDPAFCLDVKAWCNRTGHELLEQSENDGRLVAIIRKKK